MAITQTVGPYEIGSEMVTFSDQAEPPEIRGTTAVRWYVAEAASGRKVVVGLASEAEAVERARLRIAEGEPVEIALVDGRTVTMPRANRALFRGLDADGNGVYAMSEEHAYLYAVTPCCQASGKGSFAGVVCRACHRVVDDYFGGRATLAVPVAPDREQPV
jgi:hypothetical protein